MKMSFGKYHCKSAKLEFTLAHWAHVERVKHLRDPVVIMTKSHNIENVVSAMKWTLRVAAVNLLTTCRKQEKKLSSSCRLCAHIRSMKATKRDSFSLYVFHGVVCWIGTKIHFSVNDKWWRRRKTVWTWAYILEFESMNGKTARKKRRNGNRFIFTVLRLRQVIVIPEHNFEQQRQRQRWRVKKEFNSPHRFHATLCFVRCEWLYLNSFDIYYYFSSRFSLFLVQFSLLSIECHHYIPTQTLTSLKTQEL